MNNRNIFRLKRTSMAVLLALASPVAMQLAHAGAGWGNSTNALGGPIKTPTYYANSPSGIANPTACFSAPPATGAFDTLALTIPTAGTNCDTGTALRKFVDPMSAIPVAVPDKATYLGSDYYEIAAVEYTQKMHSDLFKATTLRGYVQISATGTVPLTYLNGTPILLPNGIQAKAVAKPSYLGPIISATSGTPTRVKFYNLLPAGTTGNLHVPVDETITGAGTGPDGVSKYLQNRVEIHLHGGDNPWISDGTPHQWILPAADETALKLAGKPEMARGISAKNVPDMPDPGPGAMTYYFPNGQSGRMMFYHDHALGLTRLNVYSGVVAGYVLNDLPGVGENHISLAGLLPTTQIPLIIQDKTFVPKDIATQDAKWRATLGQEGDLWYPHVYETNQDPNSVDGTNAVGRWDWGPWFWPVFPSSFTLPTGEVGALNAANISEVSTTPEAFMDTPVVNGTAYPTMTVEPKAYRFRVLNGANDRFLNLGLYLAADKLTTDPLNPKNPLSLPTLCDGITARPATALVNPGLVPTAAECTEVKMVNFDASYVPPVAAYTPDGTLGFPTTTGITGTGWGALVGGLFPQGAPDPATAGPHIVQIGNEGGLLANPLDIPSTTLNYEYNKRSVTILNVQERGLFLGTAERADVLIDFSAYAGKTLILYNDAPAPVPASDPRIDYYTGNPDQTGAGGAPSTKPGYGPNIRTIMQIVVAPTAAVPETVNLAALKTAIPTAYASKQAMPIVPEPEFNAAFPSIATPLRNNARIYTGSVYLSKYQGVSFNTPEAITYMPAPTCTTVAACNTALAAQKLLPNNGLVTAPAGTAVSAFVQSKAIQELFDPTYGRMNATLGVELPFTSAITQTTIPLGYVDPTTETVADGETQFWKITHNGVDTHPVHFHLVNVQVLNRIGWDGTVKTTYGDEIGWKETVKMNPLEDIIVAVRAKKPNLQGITAADGITAIPSNAFGLPLSSRLMDPSQPAGSAIGFTQVNPVTGTPAVVTNSLQNYGWEYVWHCHILGHEENDFMRPVKFDANEIIPLAPTSLAINATGTLTWIDNATTEYKYMVERALVTNGVVSAYGADLAATVTPQLLGSAPLANATTFTDTTAPVIATTTVAAPVLTVPTGANLAVNSVVLTWPADISAASYTVERDAGLGFVALGSATVTGATASYTDLTVVANTAYTYRVSAVGSGQAYSYRVTAVGANGSGASTTQTLAASGTASTTLIVTTPASGTVVTPTPTPTPPPVVTPPGVNLVAVTTLTAQASGTNLMQLNWTDASTLETGYSIQRCTGAIATTCAPLGTGWANIATGITPAGALISVANGPMSAAITANLAQNTLSYRIYPLNGATIGPVSNTVTVNLGVNPVAPTTVAAIPAVGSVALTWVDVATNNTSYRIRSRYQTSLAGAPVTWSAWTNATVTPAIGANATTATLTAAQIGASYAPGLSFQFQVGARNAQGQTYASSPIVVVQ